MLSCFAAAAGGLYAQVKPDQICGPSCGGIGPGGGGTTKTTPTITWATPTAITYGTTLSATQLDATASVAGTFAYSPASGAVLAAGLRTLSVTFAPTDTTDYTTATATVALTVIPATPTITWATPAAILYGTALSATQLNATGSITGTFVYAPAVGTVLTVGTQTLSVTFTPTDTTDYSTATSTVHLTVDSAGTIYDTGTVTLTVNGNLVSTTNYGEGATPSSVAEGLALGVVSGSPVTVTAVGDAMYIDATGTGSASDYSYSIQNSGYDSNDFSQPSFPISTISGTLEGGNAQATNAGAAIYSFQGGYDGVGNLIGYTDSVMGAWNFSYDALSRLTTAEDTATTSTSIQYANNWGCWSYDAFGNRTSQSMSSTPCGNNPPLTSWAQYNGTVNGTNNNQMSQTNQNENQANGYDAAGDVINDGVNQYLYDGEGRICAVLNNSVPSMPVMTGYIYDADGTRVAKGSLSQFTCDLNPEDTSYNGFQTIKDYIIGSSGEQMTEMGTGATNNMTPLRNYVYAAGTLIATYDPDGLHFYFNDPLGTRRVQTDYAGVIEQQCTSLPYGDAESCSGGHLFTGKERDAESGNDYFGARYYASSTGRYLSPDPMFISAQRLTDPQSLNLYAYVRNNPLGLTDDSGLDFYLACLNSGPDHSGCGQVQNGGSSVWVQGRGSGNKFQAYDIDMNRDASGLFSDQFGNDYKGTFDKNGVSFSSVASGGASGGGTFIEGSDQTDVDGSGLFSGLQGHFVSACGGSCDARGSLTGPASAFATMEGQLNRQSGVMSGLDLLSGAHSKGIQWKDSNGFIHVIQNGLGTRNAGITEMHFEGHPTGVDVTQFVLHMVDTIRDASNGAAAAQRNMTLPRPAQ